MTTDFVTEINKMAADISRWAENKGFWESPISQDLLNETEYQWLRLCVKSQKIALMHSELSELLEGLRKPTQGPLVDFTNEEEELADLIIRALDYAGHYQLAIGDAIVRKMNHNYTRPQKHGKEF